MPPPKDQVAQILDSLAGGNEAACETLFPMVYDELHRLATSFMRGERADHTLGPTALIHEAYLRLVQPRSQNQPYENLDHFMATAAVVMRRILVNHAKAKKAEKRGGGRPRLQLDALLAAFDDRSVDLLALDEALERLRTLDPIQHRLVELRFFGGMTMEQCATILDMSPRTVYYEWSHARAWLRDQLEEGEQPGE